MSLALPGRRARRLATLAAAAAATALLLTACSGSSDPAETGTTAATTAPEVDADFFFEAGDLPAEPTRVVALWRTGAELVDIGVIPVGTLDDEIRETELTPEQWESAQDVPTVGSFEGVDIEKIIDLDPDLVIGMDNGGLGIDYESIGELYPVRILKVAEPTDVWDNYETVAALVGRSTDFDKKVAELDARLADIQSTYGDALDGALTTSLSAMQGSVLVDTSKSLSYRRLVAAGFTYNPVYTDNPERYVTQLSLENLPSLADQKILFHSAALDGSVSPDVQALLDEPAFAELPAVTEGHLYPLRGSVIYTFAGADAMVDDLEAAAQAFAGE